jgi:precorrin-6B methylase 1
VVGVGEQPDVMGLGAGQRVEHAEVQHGPQRLLDEQLW